MALRFLLRFPAFSQKEQNGPFFTFPWRFQMFLAALGTARTLHRAPVGQGPSGPDWLATALGFWSGRALATGTAGAAKNAPPPPPPPPVSQTPDNGPFFTFSYHPHAHAT